MRSLTLFLALTDPSLSRSFGMVHDGEGNVCKKSEGHIMSPTLAGRNGVFYWSPCSRQYLHRFLRYEPRGWLRVSRCLGRSRLGPPSPVGAVPRLRGTGCSPPYCVARFLRGLGTRAICGPGVGVPHCKGDAKSMLPYFQNTRMLAGNRREVATSVSLNTLTCLSFIKESVRIIALISIICSWGKNLTHETTLP